MSKENLKTLFSSAAALVASLVTNILIIMFLWGQDSVELYLWVSQSLFTAYFCAYAVSYGSEGKKTNFVLCIGIATAFLGMLLMDAYRIYATPLAHRSFSELGGFFRFLSSPKLFFTLLFEDSHLAMIILFYILCIPMALMGLKVIDKAFIERFKSKFSVKKST
ncbi:MAG: hypothetical protein AAF335_03315 [Bacteroidota bacterium]